MTTELTTFDRIDLGPRHGIGSGPIVALGDAFNYNTLIGGRGLLPCTDWDAAEWRYPAQLHDLAVNVEITGRTRKFRDGAAWIRARITFVGDGEPDTVVKGWARVA